MKIKLIEDPKIREQDLQIDSIQRAMEQEQKERAKINSELYFKEKELIEKEKFHELLIDTDENLRRMEEEKMVKDNMRLKANVDSAIMQARENRESKLREVVRDREMNFQEYTVKRHNQIREEYNKKMQDEIPDEASIASESAYKEDNSIRKSQSFRETKEKDIENMSPNRKLISPSEFSNSINQKYLNKDVYESYSRGIQQPSFNQDFVKRSGPLIQSYPISDNINGSRVEMNLEEHSQSQDENSEYTDENSIIQRHENSKNAFENYKKSLASRDNFNGYEYSLKSGEYSYSGLPVKDSTFGMYNDPYDEENKNRRMYPVPFGSMEGLPPNDMTDVRSQLQFKAGKFSEFSSPITEEDEGESSISYDDGQGMTSNPQFHNIKMRGDISTSNEDSSNYMDTSEISSSTISESEKPNYGV